MAEDTQEAIGTQKTATEDEALIQEMLRGATVAEVPSELKRNPVIHKGDGILPAPMVVKEISSAGHVWIWDSRTYEKIPVLYYMLPQKMRLRRQDGSFVFTTNNPGKLPKMGKVRCMLHKESENRKTYDEMGFRVCPKANITNQHELRMHMLRKHPQEWAAIEEDRKDRERKEDRDFQRAILKGQFPGTQETDNGKARQTQEKQEVTKATFICDTCGLDFGAQITMEKHKQEQHK